MRSLVTFAIVLIAFTSTVLNAQDVTMRITVDNNLIELWINGEEIEMKDLPGAANWQVGDTVEFKMERWKNVVAMLCTDSGVIAGLLVDLRYDKTTIISDKSWKFSNKEQDGWHTIKFDDGDWDNAVEYHQYPEGIWAKRVPIFDKPMTNPWWIWSDVNFEGGKIDPEVYFRLTFGDLSVESVGKMAIFWGDLKTER